MNKPALVRDETPDDRPLICAMAWPAHAAEASELTRYEKSLWQVADDLTAAEREFKSVIGTAP